ncbi:mKIAA0493 protein, putative [Trichomonas vaginalis G3]|uniref:MKIAA0493 protein, putative n=1 Tax=Trichomonas vaginalis (strain ATCC PRA-98 / G3) TaxID=412133 RepID=A2DDA8_TRIV3|nr:Fam91A1 family [Trichomonas vaginalis G3]EAY21587.1 mKIAA0493 protein, putative [Trichomonas vaginalis G3]KAI5489737.1 Fam91A1 family [Trichomonas vaginalis G3]|eukprot:XP_001582573.1 mKIAA0493 protein [Trichomonas vaginalis G3]
MIQEEDTSKFLEEATPWEKLSPSAQAYFGTPAQFQQRILHYFFDHQKPYEQALTFIPLNQYYQQLIEFGINNYLVFPYHLFPQYQRNPAVTPFYYYSEMLLRVMQSDKSYHSIPNFSAADALRVTGVGRNQFIDGMNKSRAGGWSSMLKSKEKVLRSILPQQPQQIPLSNWWILTAVPAQENKLAKLPSSARLAYERIAASQDGVEIGQFEEAEVRALYNECLIYISIPLAPQDTIKLLTLEKFVMNRMAGDYLEGLCYKSFISIDDRTTVEQLSKMLAVDVNEITKVLSFFIRLGLATKVTVDDQVEATTENSTKRLAAIYDCNLPSDLMVGNLGSTIKSYAVTLFEVGKMTDTSLTEFIQALQEVQSPADDSMVKSYERCQVIARIGNFLRSQKFAEGGVDFLRLEALLVLDEESRTKLFERNYNSAVALAPLTLTQSSLEINGVVHFGPPSHLFHSPWVILYLNAISKRGPPVYVWPQGEIVTSLPEPFFDYETVRLYKWGNEAVDVPTTTLLISLNDALPSSPVLIQCYKKKGDEVLEKGFPNEEINDPEIIESFSVDTMFGFMTFVVRDGENIPIDIAYGIPTTKLKLCESVIETIEKRDMFEEENIKKMEESTKKITNKLEEFVKEWSCGIMTPVRPLYSIGDKIKWV